MLDAVEELVAVTLRVRVALGRRVSSGVMATLPIEISSCATALLARSAAISRLRTQYIVYENDNLLYSDSVCGLWVIDHVER